MRFQFLGLISTHSKEALIRATEGNVIISNDTKKKSYVGQKPAVWEEEMGGGRRHVNFMTGYLKLILSKAQQSRNGSTF